MNLQEAIEKTAHPSQESKQDKWCGKSEQLVELGAVARLRRDLFLASDDGSSKAEDQEGQDELSTSILLEPDSHRGCVLPHQRQHDTIAGKAARDERRCIQPDAARRTQPCTRIV